MQIHKNMKMADVIHLNYTLLPIIQRFGINLGFGEKTVAEICNLLNINLHFFLDITNAYHDENYFPQKHLSSFSASLIIEYLKKTHLYYMKEQIPDIENQIKELVNSNGDNIEKFKLVENFFIEYKNELSIHIKREEDEIYPYIIELENAITSKNIDEGLVKKIKDNSINIFAEEHDNVEEKLYDLKNILIKYLPTKSNTALLNVILFKLFQLEKDLKDHSKMEDKVLIPKVASMEKIILS